MDIFKFNNPSEKTLMEQGQIINGLISKMWIERYRDAGEFTLEALVSSNLRFDLPVGSFISHTNTQEIMVVESHEITESKTAEAVIKITGRSLETLLEQRVLGANKTFPVQGQVVDITIPADYVPNQVVTLINTYIGTAALINDDDAIPHIIAFTNIPNANAYLARTSTRTTVYDAVKNLLKIGNYGIKSQRYGPLSTHDRTWSELIVHEGTNRAPGVIFSNAEGDIEHADYLWSNKNVKNAALVTSKWAEVMVNNWNGTQVGYDRRILYVSASDIDQQYSTQPTGSLMTSIINSLTTRGQSEIQAHNATVVINPNIAINSNLPVYRKDYFVGDVVQVGGGYRQSAQMRVSEYVEVEDDNGESGYPTFTDPGDLNV